MTMDRGCGFLWRYWVDRLMPMPHKQVGSAWPIQLLQLTAWARGRCTRAGHKCWVMLEIQKYSNIYGQHESNTQATGHSTVAKTGLRIPRTDAWIASPTVRLRYWYLLEIHSDIAGTLGTKSGAALHAPLCVCLGRASRCVSRAQRESGSKIVHDCNYATARYKTCLCVAVYLCVCGDFSALGIAQARRMAPAQWFWERPNASHWHRLRDAATDWCFFSVCEK